MSRLLRPTLTQFLTLLTALLLTTGSIGCGDSTGGATDVEDDADVGTPDVDNDTGPDLGDDTAPDTGDDPADEPDAGDDTGIDSAPDRPIEDTSDDAPIEEGNLRLVGVNPQKGPTAGGTEILVIGLGFTIDTDVVIGGSLCQNIDVRDETTISCDTPANPAGVYDVKVINPDERASLVDGFTYFAPIGIDSIDPDRGPSEGGMPATIEGSGFGANTQVSIGGRVALGVEVVDSETIRLLTPPGDVGLARVQVAGENGLDIIEGAFEYYDPVVINQILPGAGPAAGGTDVTIIGAGFTNEEDMSVRFGLLEAEFEVISATELAVTTPPGPGDSAVSVTVGDILNGEMSVPAGFYYYTASGDPDLMHIAPVRGSTAGGDAVVLSGTGLDDVDEVTFDASEATIDVQTDSYLIVTTPSHATGAVDVTVSETAPPGSDTLSGAFTYIQNITLDSIDPATGDIAGGDAVTITGTGFESGMRVRIGPLAASDVVVQNATTITATTPPGIPGPANVRVTHPDGLQAVLIDGFTYTSETLVLGFAPTKGALSGGTWVLIRGAGFIEPVTVTFGGVESTVVDVLDTATLAVRTPPNGAGFVNVAVTSGEDGEPVVAEERFLYFDPTLSSGGHFGDPINGAVNVTVLTAQGAPLPDALVMLSVREDAEFFGYTDANGQVTLSGPDLLGAQTVTATRIGFSSSTVDTVDAENITIILSCVPDNQCASTDACRDGFVCTCGPPYGPIGICLVDNFCGFEAQSQEEYEAACIPDFPPLPFGIISGNLTGVHKVDDPGPNERIMAIVVTTQPHPFQSSPVDPGTGNVLSDDGPYTLRSRTGEIAVIAVCGLYNDVTEVFTPRYMAVRRGLFVVNAETYNVNLDCDIEMDQVLSIKVPNSPFTPNGPDNYFHTPFLHMGSEGYFGGMVNLTGTDDLLTSSGFAPLEGVLAGLDYYIVGGAFTGNTFPQSASILRGVTNVNNLIVLPEFMPAAEMTQPQDGALLVERYLEWEMATDATPDFYSLLIFDFNGTLFWDVLVPGDLTTVNLPFFPEGEPVSLFPSGTLILQITAVDALTFDYDNFDNSANFVLNNWRSWSDNLILFGNP